MSGLRSCGAGVIYITHRLEEIFALADRVTVLRDGESVGTSRVSEVTESSLIQQMVGRALAPAGPPAVSEPGACKLSLTQLGCAASRVREVSLDLRAGEIAGVAGLVGEGRTELARTIFGIIPADSGAMFLAGERIEICSSPEAIAHGIALLPEDRRRHGIIMEMSAAANITLASHLGVAKGPGPRMGRQVLANKPSQHLAMLGELKGPLCDLVNQREERALFSRGREIVPRALQINTVRSPPISHQQVGPHLLRRMPGREVVIPQIAIHGEIT